MTQNFLPSHQWLNISMKDRSLYLWFHINFITMHVTVVEQQMNSCCGVHCLHKKLSTYNKQDLLADRIAFKAYIKSESSTLDKKSTFLKSMVSEPQSNRPRQCCKSLSRFSNQNYLYRSCASCKEWILKKYGLK